MDCDCVEGIAGDERRIVARQCWPPERQEMDLLTHWKNCSANVCMGLGLSE